LSRIQLYSREWYIIDELGENRTIVAGEGVIGKKPVLDHSRSFIYSSHIPLTVPQGMMRGRYQMYNHNTKTLFYVYLNPVRLDFYLNKHINHQHHHHNNHNMNAQHNDSVDKDIHSGSNIP
jgi:uncharacterized protein affecting Mg2+/Co2+ transport